MAWTDSERARVQAIESMLNDLQTAVNNLVSRQQLNQVFIVRQREIDDLKERMDDVESQVEALQGYHT